MSFCSYKSLTAGEGDPACVLSGLSPPVRCHQQAAGDGEGDDAHDNEEERGDPFWRQPWGNACAVAPMDGLALSDQAHRQRTWREGRRGRKKVRFDKSLVLGITCSTHACLY